MSLTHRLLALTLAASLPGLAAVTYSAYDLRNTRYSEVRVQALRNAQVVVSELDKIFDGVENTLRTLAEADEVSEMSSQACSDYVARVQPNLASLTSVLVVDMSGNIRCFSDSSPASPNLAQRDYFRAAVDKQTFAIGTYTSSEISNRKLIPLSMPVTRDGKKLGAIVAGLNLEWLSRQFKERGIAEGSSILVLDRNGVIVSRQPSPERYIGTRIGRIPSGVGSTAPGYDDIVGLDGVPRVIGYVPAAVTPFGMYVASGISHAEAFSPIDRALRNSFALFALGTLVAFLLAWLVGESIIRRPLTRIVATAEAWRRGHDAARTGIVDRDDEIGVLGQTFDRLMDENSRREEQRAEAEQRREILVHELAHRVKNTLATVQSMASLSFRNSQGPEALREFHERLQALVRSHDLLTRKSWMHADLSEVTEAAVAPMREERQDRFTISGQPVPLQPTTAVPISMILHELCTNALKYGALSTENGRVTIRWTARPADHGTAVSLIWSEDGGPPVRPPEEEGFGTRLITNLSRQLGGDCNFRYPPSGLVFHLSFAAPASTSRD